MIFTHLTFTLPRHFPVNFLLPPNNLRETTSPWKSFNFRNALPRNFPTTPIEFYFLKHIHTHTHTLLDKAIAPRKSAKSTSFAAGNNTRNVPPKFPRNGSSDRTWKTKGKTAWKTSKHWPEEGINWLCGERST